MKRRRRRANRALADDIERAILALQRVGVHADDGRVRRVRARSAAAKVALADERPASLRQNQRVAGLAGDADYPGYLIDDELQTGGLAVRLGRFLQARRRQKN